jgi:hypothetical protein
LVHDKKDHLLMALTVAFERTEVAQRIGMPALGQIFDAAFTRIYDGRGLNLGPLWDLLLAEPGAEPSLLHPPMLALKSWEGMLGILITLPPAVEDLSAEKRRFALSQIGMPAGEAIKTINARLPHRAPTLQHPRMTTQQVPRVPTVEQLIAKAAMEAAVDIPPPLKAELLSGTQPALARPRQGLSLGVFSIAVLAVLAAGAGFYAYQSWFRTVPVRAFDPAKVRHIVILRDSEQRGPYFQAVIADEEWDRRPEPERQRRVQLLADELRPNGMVFVTLRDPKGRVRATGGSGGVKIVDPKPRILPKKQAAKAAAQAAGQAAEMGRPAATDGTGAGTTASPPGTTP